MKKSIFAIAMLSFSMSAAAAPTLITGAAVTNAECAMLAESVNLSLSANVSGAYNCIDGVDKEIRVATCSSGGRTSPRTVNTACNAIGLLPAAPTFITGAPVCAADGTGPLVEVRGANIYAGSTAGGTIAASPNSTVCDNVQVQAATL